MFLVRCETFSWLKSNGNKRCFYNPLPILSYFACRKAEWISYFPKNFTSQTGKREEENKTRQGKENPLIFSRRLGIIFQSCLKPTNFHPFFVALSGQTFYGIFRHLGVWNTSGLRLKSRFSAFSGQNHTQKSIFRCFVFFEKPSVTWH